MASSRGRSPRNASQVVNRPVGATVRHARGCRICNKFARHHTQRLRTRAFGLLLGMLLGAATGCATASMTFTSYKDPFFPETFSTRFPNCVYRTGPTGDIFVTARATEDKDARRQTQYLDLHVFWKPKPGKTWAESSTTDAILRYVVTDETGAAVYIGTGFAYPKQTLAGGLEIRLESGRLRLESRSGELEERLGDMGLTGTLTPRRDPGATANLQREAELAAAR